MSIEILLVMLYDVECFAGSYLVEDFEVTPGYTFIGCCIWFAFMTFLLIRLYFHILEEEKIVGYNILLF
jgi:hypothetical protein